MAPEGISTSEVVAESVGISTEAEAAQGAVGSLDAHSGVLRAVPVDWIKAVENS